MSDLSGTGYAVAVLLLGFALVTMSVSAYYDGTRAVDDPLRGVTASGARTIPGTLACGPGYTFGTRFYVPGVGWYMCKDRGRLITDNHIDLWMPTRAEAMKWGRQTLMVIVVRR